MIGIDLGGTNIRVALMDEAGRIVRSHRMPTRLQLGVENLLDRLTVLCRELLNASDAPCHAVGIGIPGIIAASGTVRISPNLPQLNGVPLARLLEERLRCPTLAVNDADAIAWGEACYGAARAFSSFLTVTLGTGVGGGLVLNRSLWQGAEHGAACEIGHITVEPEGRLCGCGNHGCLETYASATGMVRSVREALQRGATSPLDMLTADTLTAQAVAEAARQHDRVAMEALALAGRKLGQALAAVVNLLNPEALVFCGGASNSLDLLRPHIEQELARRSFVYAWRKIPLLQGTLGDDAGVLGAADLASRLLFFERLSDIPPHSGPAFPNRSDALEEHELYGLIDVAMPEQTLEKVVELFETQLAADDLALLRRSHATTLELYAGRYPGYQACVTAYHDLSHATHTFLTLARILHGGVLCGRTFGSRVTTLALCAALFHDAGYLLETGEAGSGASYTRVHVQRSIALFRRIATEWGLEGADIVLAEQLMRATDLGTDFQNIPFPDDDQRLAGQLLDAADLLAQMADRAYLEKLLLLYQEFREAGLDLYVDESDLLRKTIDFYEMAERRLSEVAPLIDLWLRAHYRYCSGMSINPYQDTILRQRTYLEQILEIPDIEPGEFLKRNGSIDQVRQRFASTDRS